MVIGKLSGAVYLAGAVVPTQNLDLWHQRLGHLHAGMLKRMLPDEKFAQGLECISCIQGKLSRAPCGKSNSKAKSTFELVHTDVWTFRCTHNGWASVFVTFIDDVSRFCFIYLIKLKSQVFAKFKEFEAIVTNVHGKLRVGTHG